MDCARPNHLVVLVPIQTKPIKRPRQRQGLVGPWDVALFPPSGALLTSTTWQQRKDEESWLVEARQLSQCRNGLLTRCRALSPRVRLVQPKLTDIGAFLAHLTTLSEAPKLNTGLCWGRE